MKAVKNENHLYEIEINGRKYEFSKWGAEESYDVLLDLAKICGKPLGIALGAFVGGEDKQIDPNAIGMIMESLTQGIGDKATTKAITKKLVCGLGVSCDAAKINFDQHYKDKLDEMFLVMWAALEVQYGNFFDAVSGIVRSQGAGVLRNRLPT